MKKFLSILMAAAMLLSVCALSACGGSEEPAPEDEGYGFAGFSGIGGYNY